MKLTLPNVFSALIILFLICPLVMADDGCNLRMSHKKLDDAAILNEYRQVFSSIEFEGDSDTPGIVREESKKWLEGH